MSWRRTTIARASSLELSARPATLPRMARKQAGDAPAKTPAPAADSPSPPRTGRGTKGEVSKTNSSTPTERGVHAASTSADQSSVKRAEARAPRTSALLDTRVVYCGDNLEQLRKLPPQCVDLIYIAPPFNSNRNYEVFWGETKEMRAFDDRHENTQAYIDFMRPRCMELARVLKKTGSFYYHCDWHAAHYVKVMLDQIFGENNFQRSSFSASSRKC